jgi:sporulation protein YlmC with PRC-barrel domain
MTKIIQVMTCLLILLIGQFFTVSVQAENASVVGGSLMAVNVEIVTTTGYRASKLLGSAVYNEQAEKIGILEDFIVGSNAAVSVAIIGVGGFLGMGTRLVAVPAALIESNDQNQIVLPKGTREELKALPEFRYVQ